MATMYKFVSYTGLDCSAFFFWDFFFFFCAFHGVLLLFIFHSSSAGITLFLFSLALNEAKIIYTLVLKKRKKKRKKERGTTIWYRTMKCQVAMLYCKGIRCFRN